MPLHNFEIQLYPAQVPHSNAEVSSGVDSGEANIILSHLVQMTTSFHTKTNYLLHIFQKTKNAQGDVSVKLKFFVDDLCFKQPYSWQPRQS